MKLRADRNSGGAVKWLELLPPPISRPYSLSRSVRWTAVADGRLYDCRDCRAEANQDKDPLCVQLYSGRVRSSSARLRSRSRVLVRYL